MCHFIPVHHFEWHFWPGRGSKYNRWLSLPKCLSSVALYGNSNMVQLPFKSLVEEYKVAKVRTTIQFKNSKDPKIAGVHTEKKWKAAKELKIVEERLYRTLHSYNLIWAVCHLFPQQRWRTHTYLLSGNHWPGEPRDLRKTTSARKFRPAFGATSKTRTHYKYISLFLHNFFAAATHSLQCDSTDVK